MHSSVSILIILSLFAPVQPPDGAAVRGDSPTTRKRLIEAEQLFLNGKTIEAREAISKIVDDAGDDLIPIDDGHHVPARRIAQSLFARLPTEQLETLRTRAEPAAGKALAAAKATREIRPLEVLVDRFPTPAPPPRPACCSVIWLSSAASSPRRNGIGDSCFPKARTITRRSPSTPQR